MSKFKLHLGDCLEQMKTMPDNSVDSIVTDPPYGLSFMGKKWDHEVPSSAIWKEALRVLKPGGHLLAFFGTRTYHRGVVNIEDAGFEIRDQIMWVYGSGFPKSQNVGKTSGDERFNGWGTALKPANEPIVVARKPLSESTVAKNVLKWGTGALNIDAGRIGTEVRHNGPASTKEVQTMGRPGQAGSGWNDDFQGNTVTGRWPANFILDESAAAELDAQSGIAKAKPARTGRRGGVNPAFMSKEAGDNEHQESDGYWPEDMGGGASRFFYVAKASKRERGEGNNHPTVKPIKLMEYLVALVTPAGGTVLDPFMGSGTTGIAVLRKNFDFIGIEMDAAYLEIARKRLGAHHIDDVDSEIETAQEDAS